MSSINNFIPTQHSQITENLNSHTTNISHNENRGVNIRQTSENRQFSQSSRIQNNNSVQRYIHNFTQEIENHTRSAQNQLPRNPHRSVRSQQNQTTNNQTQVNSQQVRPQAQNTQIQNAQVAQQVQNNNNNNNLSFTVDPESINKNGSLPDFPTEDDKAKAEFAMKLVRDFPNATRKELEAKYNNNLIFAGGGQGNVIIVKDTPYVIKKNLEGPEAETYKFFAGLGNFLKHQGPFDVAKNLITTSSEITSRYNDSQLQEIFTNREDILKSFPIPLATTENNQAVAIKNVNYDENNTKISDVAKDVKIGAKIVKRSELLAHNNPEGRGLFSWHVVKRFATKILPFFKNTNNRGYEYIPQTSGFGKSISRVVGGIRSETILNKKFENITPDQREQLHKQLIGIIKAHKALPITFVGASAMIGLPDDDIKRTNICIADFAHGIQKAEINHNFNGWNNISSATYNDCKNNFKEGIVSLTKTLESVMIARNDTYLTDDKCVDHQLIEIYA